MTRFPSLLPPLAALAFALAFAAALPAADNLVFNGGFELGAAGFECNRYLVPARNPAGTFDPPGIDRTAPASGAACLRIANRFGDGIELFGRGVVLKPSTTYTMAVSLRSASPATIAFGLVNNDWANARSRLCTTSASWQRFSFTFTTTATEVAGNVVHFRINHTATGPAAAVNDYWIDDLQLNEGAAAPPAPAAEVELALTSERDLYTGPGATAHLTLHARNTTDRVVRGTVPLRLEEDDGRPPRRVGAVALELQPGEVRRLDFTLPLDRFQSFTLVPEPQLDATCAALPAWFAAAGIYTARAERVDLGSTFVVGANAGLGHNYWPAGSIRGTGAAPEEYLRLYRAMGGRFARLWDTDGGFAWGTIEPRKGEFDFTVADWTIDAYRRHGISPLPVLGGVLVFNPENPSPEFAPAWLRAESPVVDPSPYFTARGMKLFLPSDARWREHVARQVEHFRGRVDWWEILNEADSWLPDNVNQYMAYLGSASDEIRRADPAAKIVAYCSTSDAFLNACLARGGLTQADVVSFHPYGARTLGSTTPADTQIAGLRRIIADAAAAAGRPPLPLYNGELYYLQEGVEDGTHGAVRPRHVATRILTDLGEGLIQSSPAHENALWKKTLNPGFRHEAMTSRWLPSANFVAYNAFARLLEGARPAGRIPWGPHAVAYVYERDGRPLAAAWTFHPVADATLVLPDTLAGTALLDVFGNPVAAPAGICPVGASPVYLIPPEGTTTAAFLAALRAAGDPALLGSPLIAAAPGQKVALRAAVPAWPGRTITAVEFAVDGVRVGSAVHQPSTQSWDLEYTAAAAGPHEVAITATDSAGLVRTGRGSLFVGPSAPHGSGGRPRAVPAGGVLRVAAADFDDGGEGLAYHDTDRFTGDWHGRDTLTPHEVDLRQTPEGVAIGSVLNGEWVRYTLTVPAAGDHRLRLRYTNMAGSGTTDAKVTVKWMGTVVAAGVPVVPQTADWNTFANLDVTLPALAAGTGALEIRFDVWGWGLAWFELGAVSAPTNHAPVIGTARPVTLAGNANAPASVRLAAADADGDALAWSIAGPPAHGTAAVDAAGLVTYTPAADFAGADRLAVRVSDGRGGSDLVDVAVTVNAVNLAPAVAVLPLGDPPLLGVPVVLTAEAEDRDGVVAGVDYSLGAARLGTAANRAAAWGLAWTPAALGPVAITAVATDSRGAASARSAPVTATVVRPGSPLAIADPCGTAAPAMRGTVGVVAADTGGPAGAPARLSPADRATPGVVTYSAGDAEAIRLTFAVAAGRPAALQVLRSADGVTFTPVSLAVSDLGAAGSWSLREALATGLPAGTNFLRVVLDAAPSDLALTRVEINRQIGASRGLGPVLGRQPDSAAVPAGQRASWTVAASGTGPLLHAWEVSADGFTWTSLAGNAAYTGAASARLELTAARASQQGLLFRCVVSDDRGTSVSRTASLAVETGAAPDFSVQPAPQSAAAGGTAGFSVAVTSPLPVTYQWQRRAAGATLWANLADGGGFAGTTTSTLSVAVSAGLGGDQFRCVVANANGAATSRAATLTVTAPGRARLYALATRALVGTGSDVLIPGLAITGSTPKKVIVRALGPELRNRGVANCLADPTLHLLTLAGESVAFCDDWDSADASYRAAFRAVGLADLPDGSKDAVLIATLPPGLYTPIIAGKDGGTGVALVEFYDLEPDHGTLAAIATRARVGTGADVLIPGIVIDGAGEQGLLIRVAGPELLRRGVGDALADPTFELKGFDGRTLAANDDWDAGDPALAAACAAVGAPLFAPGSKDCALLATLAPGVYTIVIRGAGETTGVALVELFAVP